jgi:hypothetical protein
VHQDASERKNGPRRRRSRWNRTPSASCADLLRTIPDDLPFHLVEDGYDIETG